MASQVLEIFMSNFKSRLIGFVARPQGRSLIVPGSADPCVIPRILLVKIDFIVLSGRFGCQ